MKRLKLIIASLTIAVFGVVALVPASTSYALDPLAACNGAGNGDNAVCQNKSDNANKLIGTLVNTLLFVVGTLSVIMIIWAGISYTISTGDSGKVTRAKNTLVYSIVGLIVAFLAYAIVNWVLQLFK